MRKALWLLLAALLLTGCAGTPKEMDRALMLRTKLLQASSCTFDAEVSADYGDKLYTFDMRCEVDKNGDLHFRVTEPKSISGITGQISRQGGALTYDDTALYFGLLADDHLSPVSAPWVLMKALRGGFLTSAGMDDGQLRLSVNDSYEDDALHLDIWLEQGGLPVRAEILFRERRILSLDVRNFQIE